MQQQKLIVIGGGAAGFFCAINVAKLYPHIEVHLVEKSNKLLSKVRISGGGRCNVTHACFSMADMIKKYPRGEKFLKKAFHHFFTTDTIQWFSDRGVALKTEEDGRMFPTTNTSQTIVDCLLHEAQKYAVSISQQTDVKSLQYIDSKWQLTTQAGAILKADAVCIAAGGSPKAEQLDWLVKLGHSIAKPVPSLFTFNMPGNSITNLMGLSVENCVVKIEGQKLQTNGPLLITHWGLSGPAVLKMSAYAALILAEKNYECTIQINWLPNHNDITLRDALQQLRFSMATTKMQNRNPFALPSRLWEYLLMQSDIEPNIRWADLPAKAQNKLIKNLVAQAFAVKGKTTFKEEFVTAGGIHTEEIDVNTMQSKLHKNLFFAGEIINVDGVTGGFNFQNAWTTGMIAAKGVGQMLS